MRRTVFAAVLAIGVVAFLPAGTAQTLEENRYASELKACAERPEVERKPCEDAVRAKIKAEHAARIERESRRRQSN